MKLNLDLIHLNILSLKGSDALLVRAGTGLRFRVVGGEGASTGLEVKGALAEPGGGVHLPPSHLSPQIPSPRKHRHLSNRSLGTVLEMVVGRRTLVSSPFHTS